ncbi:cation:proton antiporter [Solimonas terrae]|uniref:Cation:proton antiporter n=1 Tax=Solimonas terrae TaxID=1396819 RepID=A0A6M2BXN0_9GAMM|nr:cation:proton antiporter [Solimonas terrae]NGY06597.1 cation:proton antiporter [Solimonas terrae]
MTATDAGAAASTVHANEILISLLLMFAGAKLLAEIFERIKQPTVVGEILAGVLIGPSVLGWVTPNEITHTMSELGVIFLLFSVGLETKPRTILQVGVTATLVAVIGVIVPFIAGWAYMHYSGHSQIESLFLGAAMVATSVGITARVLSGMGLLSLKTSRIILGAAVIDDVLGLLVLSVVSSMAGGAIDYAEVGLTAGLSIGFIVAVAVIGAPAMKHIAPKIIGLRIGHSLFIGAILLCFALATVAATIGIAAIVGAFLAGMALAEAAEQEHATHEQVRGVTEFFTPFFLVNIGMQLNLGAFGSHDTIVASLVVTVLAVVTKFVGCGLASIRLGLRRAAQVGIGMAPRGEVGIVVAQIGLGLGVISDHVFAVVLFMAVATTMIAPPLLVPLFKGERPEPLEGTG